MNEMTVTDSIRYIGVQDTSIDLFESQYVVPEGISYNSYVIMDEKVTVMDTVDQRATDAWLANLRKVLEGKSVDYLVVQHMEPDHAGNIQKLAELYPKMKLIGNVKTFAMMKQFFDMDFTERTIVVKEGDSISLGSHTLQFYMAPMVHWPEVMVTYETSEKVLFAADGFGKFGTTELDVADWAREARRYYLNICGKYGVQVQALLKKAATLDISMIAPLHGPVLKEELGTYLNFYQTWSTYEPEIDGVLVAFASIHGNTGKAAYEMEEILHQAGIEQVKVIDLSRTDLSWAVNDAFMYSRVIFAAATYDGGIFPCMDDFLHHLKAKGFQKRTIGLMENGSWAPMAAKHMRAILETMKNQTIVEPVVTIKSTMTEENKTQMKELAAAIK
ncbi:MAG: MBL fold metallo-hydrolase [Lachnospiraceae bacterium]|nr:MBL fold metallo-hydrolase [Lachnospiraceae bacterium]